MNDKQEMGTGGSLASALFRDRTYNNHYMKKVGTGIKSDISSLV